MGFISFLLPFIIQHSLVPGPYRVALMDKYNNGYTEVQYDHVIGKVFEVYGPIIEKEGGKLFILSDWTDGAVNMWAERWGDQYHLEIPGGMSRYELISEEAFVVSICHELGHLLGGEPKDGLISYEGQSDYFANQDCSRLILEAITSFKVEKIDNEVQRHCMNSSEPLCQRTLQGSKSLTSYYAELENLPPPQLDTPSPDKVSATKDTHPFSQCRLDTLRAGYFLESRPVCWYKEN